MKNQLRFNILSEINLIKRDFLCKMNFLSFITFFDWKKAYLRYRFFDEVRPGGNSKTSKWTAKQTARSGERIFFNFYIKNNDSLKINLKINLILKIFQFVLNIKFSQNISFCRIITTFSGVKLTDLNRNRTTKLIKTWHLTLNS